MPTQGCAEGTRACSRGGVVGPVGKGGQSAVSQFLSTYQGRLDSKGRVSIPAPYRATLRAAEDPSVVLRMSHKYPCIEAWPARRFAELATPLESYDIYSDDHEDLSLSLWADATQVEPDKEGRIVMPEALKRHAALEDAVTFMGMGHRFDIWEPAAGARRSVEARERMEARRLTLSARRAAQ